MSFDQTTLDSLKIDRDAPSRPSSGARGWIIALVLAAVVSAAGAYWFLRESPIEVELATAIAAPAANGGAPAGAAVLNASGYVVARREATVSAKVTGKIAAVLIEEGMTVEEGQLLAHLDDQTLRPQLDLAKTQLEARRADLAEVVVRRAEAERDSSRLERLRTENLSSERDVDRAQSEVSALAARFAALERAVDVAEATVRVSTQAIEDLEVRAPFAGVIVSKNAQPGEMVSPISAGGGFTRTGIATLIDMSSREIEVDVNESFINRVRAGQKTEAVLDAYPDWVIPSHVINIVPTADRQKATVKVRIGFDELGRASGAALGARASERNRARRRHELRLARARRSGRARRGARRHGTRGQCRGAGRHQRGRRRRRDAGRRVDGRRGRRIVARLSRASNRDLSISARLDRRDIEN